MSRPFRIGAGAGYSGDRIEPARDLAERGELDVLVFECLAERTIALAQARRQQDPEAGFDPLLRERLRAVLPACLARGVRIVTNMGAANPLAAGRAALDVARELGLPRLRVAVVTGDDVLPWLAENDRPLIDGDGGAAAATASTASLAGRIVSANAYLGAEALLPALAGAPDLVITGRVADPALFLAPLVHHFGWAAGDWLRLGRGIAVGHLLECAAQVSGGYIAEPGRFDVPRLEDVGFPLAEVGADGDAVITKLAGTGGRVVRLTCTAQLLYEIEDPASYLQPDVTADFSRVQLREAGADRVAVSGAAGRARPAELKVSVGVREGFIGEGQISYGGPGARARGELSLALLEHRLRVIGLDRLEHRAELIGVNAMHGAAAWDVAAEPAEVRVRLAASCATRAEAERIGQEVEALYLNGPAAGGGVTQGVREVLAVASCLVPREMVRPAVQWLEWQR
ncbi:MAG: acyclic terpene utilization AtuA family protein [Burkholderiaceae bacterium]|nr:acyclic terpene utilization AtuA family protein [Burkholderiaceae bacterium]